MASQQANVPSSSRSAHTATHLHAASIAVPDASIVERLESQLLQITQQSSPFLQRDVILHRTDELDEGRMEVEKSNSSYAPMRKARLQSNLHLRFEEQKVEMRVYSQTQGGSGGTIHSLGGAIGATGSKYHPPDYIRLRNLTCSLLHGDEVAVGNYCESSTEDPNHSLPSSINAGSGIWKQVVATMGWTPHHTVVRKGECFVIRDRHGHRTEARLFQLYKVSVQGKIMSRRLDFVAGRRRIESHEALTNLPNKNITDCRDNFFADEIHIGSCQACGTGMFRYPSLARIFSGFGGVVQGRGMKRRRG